MGGMNICPSARVLVDAIVASGKARAYEIEHLMDAIKAHATFVFAVQRLTMCRDYSLAVTHAEDAFARILKGMADDVLARPVPEEVPES